MGFMFLFIFTFFLFVLFVCSWWALVVLMVWWVWFILKILVSELISLFFQYFMNIFNEILFIDENFLKLIVALINFFQIIIRFKIIVLIIQFIDSLTDIQIIKLLFRLIELLYQCFIILHHYFNIILFRLDKIHVIVELCMQFSLILWIFVFGNFKRFTYKKIFILIVILI